MCAELATGAQAYRERTDHYIFEGGELEVEQKRKFKQDLKVEENSVKGQSAPKIVLQTQTNKQTKNANNYRPRTKLPNPPIKYLMALPKYLRILDGGPRFKYFSFHLSKNLLLILKWLGLDVFPFFIRFSTFKVQQDVDYRTFPMKASHKVHTSAMPSPFPAFTKMAFKS